MTRDEHSAQSDEHKKTGTEFSKLRKLKIYTYIQNKLESLMKRDPLLVDTLNGKRMDLKNPTREDYDIALATCLTRSGKLTSEEIVMILKNFFSHGMGNDAPDHYFEKVLTTAHDSLDGTFTRKQVPLEKKSILTAKSCCSLFNEELHMRRSIRTRSDSGPAGLDTGFPLFNQVLGGLQEGRVISLTGGPGSGKTSFALQVAQTLAKREKVPCLFVSYDQSFFSLNLMLYSRLSGFTWPLVAGGLLKEKENRKLDQIIEKESEEWGEQLILAEGEEGHDMTALRGLCREMKPKVLIIDPIEGIPSGLYPTHNARIEDLLGALGRIALQFNLAVLAISSMDTTSEFTHYHRADAICRLSPHVSAQSTKKDDAAEISLVIEKNRFGKSGILAYDFNPLLFEFKEKSGLEKIRAW